MNFYKRFYLAASVSMIFGITKPFVLHAQVPNEVVYEPDEGGYAIGYNPAKKLGTVDLSSNASNEPFRHLIWGSVVPWDATTDYRDFGIKAVWGDVAYYKPKMNRYIDLNENSFRAGNPVYEPDPNRTGAGQTFSGVNGPFQSVTIDNINEDSRWNPFLLSESKIDEIARSIANSSIGFMRWDIESFNHEDWAGIIKGRQVWEGGKYRHRNNGGNNPEFQDMDDIGFNFYVQDRWGYIFSELFYRTKLYSGGQIKVWMYGWGPVGKLNPGYNSQFEANGGISNQWKYAKYIWNNKNRFNNKTVSETVDYMEPWDMLSSHGRFAIVTKSDPVNNSGWQVSTDIIALKNPIQNRVVKGKPTRYSATDLGPADNDKRRVKVSLHGQDGTIRLADKDYTVFFEDWRGSITSSIPKGQSNTEMVVYPWPDLKKAEDESLILMWNNMYCQRYHEPQKLGFINWEPTPRTENLFISDIFEQRIYDAIIALANLQNYGVINWDANTVGKINPMVRESLILAHKKIAPYKSHIENQILCQSGISLDNGSTWAEPGYPTKPFEQCYNGWWMKNQENEGRQFPILLATYNAQQRTILVAHLTDRKNGSVAYKIKVKIPKIGTYTFDLTSTKNLKYTVFRI